MPRFNITTASRARVNQKFRFATRSFSACLRANSARPASVFCNSCTVLAFPPFTPAPCVVTPPAAACASVQSANTKGNFECLESQCAIADFSLGAACPHVGHLYLACPAAPPSLSAFPAAPPPRFVSAASALAASDFAVCFFGFAFPAMTTNEGEPAPRRVPRPDDDCRDGRRRGRDGLARRARAPRRAGTRLSYSTLVSSNCLKRECDHSYAQTVRASSSCPRPSHATSGRTTPSRPLRHPPLCDALDMATTQEIKLFGKWTFDDVEVSLSKARRARRDVARRARDVASTIDRDAAY